jgi:hypothetical protein
MGGGFRHNDEEVYFPKTGEDIKTKCLAKIENLHKRVKLREDTIKEMLASNGLEALDIMQLMRGSSEGFLSNTRAAPQYASNAAILETKKTLRAKDWEAVEGENQRRVSEIGEIAKLEMIARNIGLSEVYHLGYSNLQYYEF